MIRTAFLGFSTAFVIGLALPGCDSKPAPAISTASPEKYAAATTLQGLVTRDSGPVKSGLIKAFSEQGELLASVELNGTPRYSLELPAGTRLPIVLNYLPDVNAGEAQRMQAVVVHSTVSKYDINPSSTRIAKQAKALGGYSHKNLVRAAEETGIVPADNKTTAGFRGDPTTQYGGWH